MLYTPTLLHPDVTAPHVSSKSFRENCGTSELAQKLMLITYAMTLVPEIAISDQRQIIPNIHRQG